MPNPDEHARRIFTLREVAARVAEIIQPHTGRQFWVRAEISSGRERGGSFYCDLVETGADGRPVAKMACTIWSASLAAMRERFATAEIELRLENGTEVALLCSIQYDPRYGLSLRAVDADPAFALGELELRKRRLLQQLEREGLFEPNRRLPVPLLPRRIGVVASHDSAAWNDFVTTLRRSPFGFTILCADAVMQGGLAERSVLRALAALGRLELDLVVVVRGGGSKTDLAWLDNEALARAVAASRHPVWTGIGHEIDTGVLDHVANRAFKTPTAVAEEIVARFTEMARHLEEARARFRSSWSWRAQVEARRIDKDRVGIRQGTRKLLDVTRAELVQRGNALVGIVRERLHEQGTRLRVAGGAIAAGARGRVALERRGLAAEARRLAAGAGRVLAEEGARAARARGRFRRERFLRRLADEGAHLAARRRAVEAADPRRSLARGFSLVHLADGTLVRSVRQVRRGDGILVRVADGTLEGTVRSTKGGGGGEGKGT